MCFFQLGDLGQSHNLYKLQCPQRGDIFHTVKKGGVGLQWILCWLQNTQLVWEAETGESTQSNETPTIVDASYFFISCRKSSLFPFNIKLLSLFQNRTSFGYFTSGVRRGNRTQDEEIVVLTQKNCSDSLSPLPAQGSLAVFQVSFLGKRKYK